MTEEQIALARRAVACNGWRWMPGMATIHDPEYGVTGVPTTWVLPVSDGGLIDVGQHYQRRGPFASALGQCVPGGGLGTRLPDLTDPATLGCLLALVRKARQSPQAFCAPQDDTAHEEWWVVCHGDDTVMAGGKSEAEALVVALEAP